MNYEEIEMPSFRGKEGVEEFRLVPRPCTATSNNSPYIHAHILSADSHCLNQTDVL